MKINKYTKQTMLSSKQFKAEKEYWLDKFRGNVVMSTFPYDYQISELNIYKRERLNFQLTGEIYQRILAISKQSEYGIYMILLSGVKYLLSKYMDSEDIIIGMPPFKKRSDRDAQNGFLALRTKVESNMTFKDLLNEVKRTVMEADEHANLPYEVIVGQLDTNYGDNSTPLFNTIVLLNNIHNNEDVNSIKYDMSFEYAIMDEHIEIAIDYNAELFGEETINQIAERLVMFYNIVTQLSHLENIDKSYEIRG